MKIYFINYSMIKWKFLHDFLSVHVIRVNDVSSIVKVARGISKKKGKFEKLLHWFVLNSWNFLDPFSVLEKRVKTFLNHVTYWIMKWDLWIKFCVSYWNRSKTSTQNWRLFWENHKENFHDGLIRKSSNKGKKKVWNLASGRLNIV